MMFFIGKFNIPNIVSMVDNYRLDIVTLKVSEYVTY